VFVTVTLARGWDSHPAAIVAPAYCAKVYYVSEPLGCCLC